MKNFLSLSALLTIALFISTACEKGSMANKPANNANNSAPNTSAPAPTDDAPRIALADAKKDFDAGTAIFVDTRPKNAYDVEHIKGAINMTSNDLEARIKELPTDKKIIAYCS